MTEPIGGYFELSNHEEGLFPHADGILLNTGRNALEYILRAIGKVNRIYLPYFTCDAVLEPIRKLRIPWAFYHITASFEIAENLSPGKGEYIIANNYFGIKDTYIERLSEKYGQHLIVDCAQALFAKPIPGIKTFYSTRKFVGVADGGVAYLGDDCTNPVLVTETERTEEHDGHLYIRKQFGPEAGFATFKENEKKLYDQPIRWMSNATRTLLEHIDYDTVRAKRNLNFSVLDEALNVFNQITLPDANSFTCPMVYPFFSPASQNLRQFLISNKVYVAKYWPNIPFQTNHDIEWSLAEKIIALPCDQRYDEDKMNHIIKLITS